MNLRNFTCHSRGERNKGVMQPKKVGNERRVRLEMIIIKDGETKDCDFEIGASDATHSKFESMILAACTMDLAGRDGRECGRNGTLR